MPAASGGRVLIVGPPGSGKSSQARQLASGLGVRHLSSGDLLRDEVRRASAIGLRAAAFIHAGELVPDWLVDLVLDQRLAEAVQTGFVLDGYPRTAIQARRLLRIVPEQPIHLVVQLAVPDEIIVERLCSRLLCSQCGYQGQGADRSTCDGCGGTMRRRSDDREEVVRGRLALYQELLAPMLAALGDVALRVVVDGDRDTDAVARDVFDLAQRQSSTGRWVALPL